MKLGKTFIRIHQGIQKVLTDRKKRSCCSWYLAQTLISPCPKIGRFFSLNAVLLFLKRFSSYAKQVKQQALIVMVKRRFGWIPNLNGGPSKVKWHVLLFIKLSCQSSLMLGHHSSQLYAVLLLRSTHQRDKP